MNKFYLLIPLYLTSLLASDTTALEKKLKMLEAVNQRQTVLINTLKEQLEDLDEKTENIETATLLDKIDLTLGFRVKMDNFDKKMADGTKISSNNLWTTKFMLGMHAKITDNMKFHGRLSMYKYWADSTKHPYSRYDNMQGRVPSDSSVYLERAYIDWYFNAFVPSALTIGRQPSADGPSHQYKENTTRKSTYSALVFDGASDGIVYTADISKITNITNAKIRFAYGKGFQKDETEVGVQNAFIGSQNDTLKDTDVTGAFFESNLPALPHSLFQIGYVHMSDIVANAMEPDPDKNKNLGDIDFIGVMAEAGNIKNSHLDLFAHFGMSRAKPSGSSFYHYNNQNFGLMQDNINDTDTKNGYAFWLGGRYTLDILNHSKIGLEYNHGSKYWVTATQGSYDVTDKLAVRGNATELYGLYPVNRYSFIRIGGIYIDYDYTGSGCYLRKPEKIQNLTQAEKSGVIDTLQSIYLQFSVRF